MTHSDDDDLERLLQAARTEAAPPDLADRVLDRLAYRTRLERIAPPRRLARRAVAWSLALSAAGVLLFVLARRPAVDPPIAAEHAAGVRSPGAAPVASTTAEHAPLASDPCMEGAVAAGTQPLIDDFEDGDDAVRPFEGRVGFWRWAREIDAPGSAPALIPIPRPDATRTNRLAQHVKGGLLVDWGATVEFDFRPACYNAAKYGGVAFQARGPGRIYLAARERSVIPIAEGGSCESDCYNPHVAKVDLEATWHTYQIHWTELRQRGMGKPALDTRRLHSLAFMIRAEDTPYDVWLDDVRFVTSDSR
jgi:hypothetical protein